MDNLTKIYSLQTIAWIFALAITGFSASEAFAKTVPFAIEIGPEIGRQQTSTDGFISTMNTFGYTQEDSGQSALDKVLDRIGFSWHHSGALRWVVDVSHIENQQFRKDSNRTWNGTTFGWRTFSTTLGLRLSPLAWLRDLTQASAKSDNILNVEIALGPTITNKFYRSCVCLPGVEECPACEPDSSDAIQQNRIKAGVRGKLGVHLMPLANRLSIVQPFIFGGYDLMTSINNRFGENRQPGGFFGMLGLVFGES